MAKSEGMENGQIDRANRHRDRTVGEPGGMILKAYTLPAAAGKEADLLQALRTLSDAVLAAGGENVDILRDTNEASCFVFIERWASLEQYEASSGAVPKALFAPIMAALSSPPSARTLLPAEG